MNKIRYAPELDGIRSIAVLFIVFYHLGVSFFSGGYIGVDIFFVLSGFLITQGIVTQQLQKSFSFFEFYKKRFFRLFPAILVTVLATLIVGILIYPPEPLKTLGESSRWATFSAANIYFFRLTGYWDLDAHVKPLLHFWSLSVEEQFYLVWPLLIALAFFLRRKSEYFLILFFLATGIVTFAFSQHYLSFNREASFYWMQLRAWEFCLGGIVAELFRIKPLLFQNKISNSFFTAVALLVCLWCAHFFSYQTVFPGFTAIPPCLASAALIAFSGNSAFRKVFVNRFSSYLGKTSYSVYLLHWPLIVFYRDLKFNFFPLNYIKTPPELSTLEIIILFLITLLLADFMKKKIEDPFRYDKVQFFQPKLTRFKGTVVGLIVVVFLSFIVTKTKGLKIRVDAEKYAKAAPEPSDQECGFKFKEGPWKELCGLGIEKMEVDVVLMGDSHMAHYTQGFHKTFKEMGLTAVSVTGGGTAPIPYGHSLVLSTKYAPFDEAFKNIILHRPKLVILSSRWDAHLSEQIPDHPGILPNRFLFGTHQLSTVESSKKAIEEGLRQELVTLNEKGIDTLILSQEPLPIRNLRNCYLRPKYFDSLIGNCLFLDAEKQIDYHQKVMDVLEAASASLSHVKVIDLVKALCSTGKCEVLTPDSGNFIYRDGDHLSVAGGVHVVSKYIKPEIQKIIH